MCEPDIDTFFIFSKKIVALINPLVASEVPLKAIFLPASLENSPFGNQHITGKQNRAELSPCPVVVSAVEVRRYDFAYLARKAARPIKPKPSSATVMPLSGVGTASTPA